MPVVSKTTVRLYPPDVKIIDAWAIANPDPETGLTPSRPTAIRRMIRAATRTGAKPPNDQNDRLATRADLEEALSRILATLTADERPSSCPAATAILPRAMPRPCAPLDLRAQCPKAR